MTRLHNPIFIDFSGEPITGRVPPRIQIFGQATDAQLGMLSHEYKLFYDCVNTMVGDFLSRDRVLSDGSRIRMNSVNGLDSILFWPAGGEGKELIPDGYLTTPTDIDHLEGWNENALGDWISPDAHIAAQKVFKTPPPITLHSKYQAGAVTWICPSGHVLSYNHGGTNRYATNLWDSAFSGTEYTTGGAAGAAIYYRGSTITAPGGVYAAAIFNGWLLALTAAGLRYCVSPLAGIDTALKQGIFRRTINPTWSAIPTSNSVPTSSAVRVSAWHFKPDGSRAVAAYLLTSTMYDDSDENAWTLEKAYRQAAPQAKWYLDFAVHGSGASAYPEATWSEESFTTEAIGPKVNGVAPGYFVAESELHHAQSFRRDGWHDYHPYDPSAMSAGGTITYTGRRLMGVDYDEAGEELVITMNISGIGSCTGEYGEDGANSGSLALSMQWDYSINDEPLFVVPTSIDALTYSQLPPADKVVTGGPFSCQYVTLYDLDARYKAYTLERLTRTAAAVNVRGTASCVIEHGFNGELVYSEEVEFPPECEPTARFSEGNGRRFEHILNNGFYWQQDNDYLYSNFAGCPILPFPTVQGRICENSYVHHMHQAYWTTELPYYNMPPPEHLAGYPNQVVDALFAATTQIWYTIVGPGMIQHLAFQFGDDTSNFIAPPTTDWSSVAGELVWIDGYPALYPVALLDQEDDGDGRGAGGYGSARYVQGIARKNYSVDHHIVATKNTASRGYYNTFMYCIQAKASFPAVYVPSPPFTACDAFIRPPIDVENPEAERPFARYDLMPVMEAKINAETPTVDQPTFRIDPIRVV